jgi:hypothetical protein
MADPTPSSAQPQAEPESDSLEPAGPPVKTEWWHGAIGLIAIIASTFCCGNFFGWWGGSEIDGIGATRAAAAAPFQTMGCAFLPAGDQRGLPSEEANGMNGMFRVTLVGREDDLAYAAVTMNVDRFVETNQSVGLVSLPFTLLKATTPDWPTEDAMQWLMNCAKDVKPLQDNQFERRTEKAIVRYRASMLQPVTITVSVESPDWE